jgi:hypothetical protein
LHNANKSVWNRNLPNASERAGAEGILGSKNGLARFCTKKNPSVSADFSVFTGNF